MNVMFASISTLSFYLVAAVGQWMRNCGRSASRHLILLMTSLGLIFHGIVLYHSIHTERGINLDVFTVGSLTSLMVTMVVVLSSLKKPSESLLAMILPVSMVMVLVACIAPIEHIIWQTPSIMVAHVLISVLAYGLFVVVAFQAALLSYQERQLHSHRRTIKTLPSLQTMEKLLFEFLLIGMVLLTMSLGSGFLFFEDMFAQKLIQKTALSIAAWCLFATLLLGRWRFGWRGQTVVRWILAGFALLIFAYFGCQLVLYCLSG